MAKLNEEIFEEPLSFERLFAIYDAARGNLRDHEWVMDERMFKRIRKLTSDRSGVVFFDPRGVGHPIRLIGLPIAIEPFAKLAIRERSAVRS